MEETIQFQMVFQSDSSANAALEGMQTVLKRNAYTLDQGYDIMYRRMKFPPSKSLSNALQVNGHIIETDEIFFDIEDLDDVMHLLTKAIARHRIDEEFTCFVLVDTPYSYKKIEISYANRELDMKTILYPFGYKEYLTCPECGTDIVKMDEYNEDKTYFCSECEDVVDLSEDYEDFGPFISERIYHI